ncbi:hypothetical protein Tco_1304485 [Tanacetum coccineum]
MGLQNHSRNETDSILLHPNRQRGKESEFLKHHFEFTAYNQLQSKVLYRYENNKMIYLILTDYLRCIRSISDIIPSGDANTLTMWDDLAKYFNKQEIEKLPFPTLIAVNSCRVSKYREDTSTYVDLAATPATFYYINPQIPEAENAYTMFKEKYNMNPPLQVSRHRFHNPEQETTHNRQTLQTLLEQDPTSFKGVRFTCDIVVTSVNNTRSWSYPSCSQCNKASTKLNGIYT